MIDVNTGRFVGSRSKKSGARLEDTITKNNLEAVKEVVRQLRLRDIGGIIVIDFIDMASPKNRAAVEKALGEELERDRTKTYVVEISPLGLVEMTRQNVTDGPREVMTKKCPTCGGDGIVVSEHTAAVDVERRLRSLVTPGSRDKAFKVEVDAKVAALVVGPGGTRLRELEETTKRRFFLVGKEGEHLDHFRVLDQGTLEKVAPKLPVEVGQELELKLGEVGLHDAHAGVGKVEGLDIVVGDAAKLVGKKVKVRINAVTEGLAWAELLSPVEQTLEPLTAESEAEKPTRARRSSSRTKDEPELEADGEPSSRSRRRRLSRARRRSCRTSKSRTSSSSRTAAMPSPARQTAPKKRTRRGTRGGRNRKKKPAGATAAQNGSEAPLETEAEPEPDAEAAEPEVQADDEPVAGPVIHVPDRDLGAPEATTTRRPTAARPVPLRRSGRAAAPAAARTAARSRRPTARRGTATAEADERRGRRRARVERGPSPSRPRRSTGRPTGSSDDDWGYTPMSEWGIDDK